MLPKRSCADCTHISSIVLLNLDKLKEVITFITHTGQDMTVDSELFIVMSVESVSSLGGFFPIYKGILHHLYTGGKDTMNLHKKDKFIISPHLLHSGIFKGTLDIMKSTGNDGGVLMILGSINMLLCLINLSFQ